MKKAERNALKAMLRKGSVLFAKSNYKEAFSIFKSVLVPLNNFLTDPELMSVEFVFSTCCLQMSEEEHQYLKEGADVADTLCSNSERKVHPMIYLLRASYHVHNNQ